jgi:hypothetical protein
LSVKINDKTLGFECGISYIYRVIRDIDMTQPHIKSSWLAGTRMMVLVLFPNGVERVMTRANFVNQMSNGFWTLTPL